MNKILLAVVLASLEALAVDVTEDTTVDTSNASTYTSADVISIAAGKTLKFAPTGTETFVIAGKITGAGNIRIDATADAGKVELRGDNDFSGSCAVAKGQVHVYSSTAFGSTTGGTTVGGGTVYFYGITVAEPFSVSADNARLIGQTGETVLSGTINYSKDWGPFSAAKDAVIRFTGSMTKNGWWCANGEGKVILDTENWQNASGFYLDRGGYLVLNHPGKVNYSVYGYNGSSKHLEAGAVDVFSKAFLCLGQSGNTGFSLHLAGFDQTVRKVSGANVGPVVYSSTPAQLRALARDTAENFGWSFTEYSGFTWAGSETLKLTAASPTKGSLKAEAGSLTLSAAATWLNATNVTVCAGAKLTADAVSFGAQVELFVEDGGKISFKSGSVQKVDKFTYKGEQLPAGIYGPKGSSAQYGIDAFDADSVGFVEVAGGEIVKTSAAWDGGPGGTGTDLRDTSNWVGDPDVVDLTSGGLTATFAEAGSAACVSGDASFWQLAFNAANGFTLEDAGNGRVLIGQGGVTTAASGGEEVAYALQAPALMYKDQGWTLGENTALKFEGGLAGVGKATVSGSGTLDLAGDASEFSGSLQLESGVTAYARTDGSLGDGTGLITAKNGSTLWLCGIDTPARLSTSGCEMTSNPGFAIRTPDNSTNVVRGAVNFQSHSVMVGAKSELTLAGGGYFAGLWQPRTSQKGQSGSRIIIAGTSPNFSNGIYHDDGSSHLTLVLKTPNIIMNGSALVVYQNNVLECEVPFALNYGKAGELALTGGGSTGSQNYFRMNGNDQAVTLLTGSSVTTSPNAGTGHVVSDKPALLHVVSNIKTDKGIYTYSNAVIFEGQAGISGEGSATIVLNAVSSTEGTLQATNGVVEIGASGSWLNCTNVVAVNKGTVSFTHAKSVSRKACVFVADDGKVSVAPGVTENIRGLFFKVGDEWREQPIGDYSSASVPADADITPAHFAGGGVLHVRGMHPGLMLLLR